MKVSISRYARAFALAAVASALAAAPSAASARPFLDQFNKIKFLATTVPASGPAAGDQNPYGVAVVPRTIGDLRRGEVLVSNFNNSQNNQGTGSSIVEVSPSGKAHVFAVVPQPTSTAAVGLTTALVALRSGYVIVGSLPAPGGMLLDPSSAGALSILDPNGHVVKTISGGDINGPWDMTAVDGGRHVTLFVTNVLNGTVAAGGMPVNKGPEGTVVRIRLRIDNGHVAVTSNRVIATGFAERTDPNALVIGPTGDALGRNGVLYVADSVNNRIGAVPFALTRMTVKTGGGDTVAETPNGPLSDPLGMAIAPNGDIITADGNDGNAVETTPGGAIVAIKTLVPNGAGDLFGIAIKPFDRGLYFVNDAGSGPDQNSLELLH
jgi:sugar lactone lactonase YvrE